ncbi:MAG: hypothetical protein ACE5JU_21825 [Candidatus Binatia bacterium]
MEEYEQTTEISIGISLVALIVGIIVFIAVWIIGGIMFNLFDSLRGLGGDKLQAISRELFVPGVGGYLAMASVSSWFERASIKFVFFGFAAVILVLVGVYIGFVGPLADKIGEDIWGLLLSIISIISAVVGAYIYAKDEI